MTRSILITGTSSGIGLAAVARFVGVGYRVAATVRKDADAHMLRDRFPAVDVLNVDLNDEAARERAIGGYLAERQGVEVVVNNAGFAQIGPVEELPMEAWRRQMETNFFAVVHITRLALPYMRDKGAGRIVQVSSGFGQTVLPIFAPYCASKHALDAFSASLRHEVAPFGIGVSLVSPGPVATRFEQNRQMPAEDVRAASPYRTLFARVRERTLAAHRRASSAEDVVNAIFRAATDRSPRLRYPVGPLGHLAAAEKLLPRRWVDAAMRTLSKEG